MKKFAIRGLVTVAVFVALCMFFSGTIKTITTAKVRLVSAKTGKLEEEIDLKGKLVFPETEEIYLAGLEDDQQVVITRVRVTQGRQVKQGDVLFEAEVSGYESALEQLEAEYTAAQSEMMELERKNGDVRLKRTEENWIAAYDALAQAKSVVREKQTALTVAAKLAGVVLEGGALPEEEKDEALLSAQQAVADAKAAESAAKTAFDSANRLGISEEIVDYVTKSRELTEKMESAQQEIAALTVLAQQAAAVTAPHDGYVVEVNVKAGDSYNGKTAAIVMNARKTKGVMRASVEEIERRIEEKAQVVMERTNGKKLSASVTGSGIDEEGKRYVDVELSDKDITNLGGAGTLMKEETEMTVSYRAGTSTTLLPVSAVRGSGDSRYVYIVDEGMNSLGERTLTIRRQDVKVITEVGSTASIEEDLGRSRVAYMEDRAIGEGSAVMVYAE